MESIRLLLFSVLLFGVAAILSLLFRRCEPACPLHVRHGGNDCLRGGMPGGHSGLRRWARPRLSYPAYRLSGISRFEWMVFRPSWWA